jgi:hypothetical protein
MLLAVIIVLPVILSFIFLYGATTLGNEHTVLKTFLFLLSIIPVFSSFYFGTTALIKYTSFTALQNAVGSTVYWIGMFFAVLIIYFLIYIFTVAVRQAAQAKKARLEY